MAGMHHVRRSGGAKGPKAMAVLATALVLAVLVIPLVSAPGGTDAGPSTYERTITYYQSQDDYKADTDGDETTVTENLLSQTYYGVATSEYNPQYWGFDKTFSSTVEKNMTFSFQVTVPRYLWSGGDVTFVPGDSHIQLTSLSLSDNEGNVSCDSTEFTLEGWGHYIEEKRATVTLGITYSGPAVFTGWVTPDGTFVEPGDIIPDGVDVLIATWSAPDCFMTGDKRIDDSGEIWYVVASRDYSQRNTGDICKEHSDRPEYTTIINVPGGTTISGTLPSGTYRGDGAGTEVTVDNAYLGGDAVFDSMAISNREYGSEKHGDQNYGLFANGHKLIMGTGLTLPSGKTMREALQVFGGSNNGAVAETHVFIHSGVYYNVVAGGCNGTVAGSTYLVMRGGVVLDTVIGGNGGQSENTVGSTHVYIVGGKLPADSYVEGEMTAQGGNSSQWELPSGFHRDESTIITGGSNNGTVTGDTHVHISGTADVWDVQAGGRRGSSTVSGTAIMEVSGKAIVRHVACGSITDGNSSDGDRSCVGSTDITVRDGAKVASVYGAGYDTYASVSYVSMMGAGSTISISIESGTVGYVYGGGYRGSVGTSDKPIDSISIEISGGTVLGDVFGGGRGGVDKAMHNPDGSMVQDPEQSGMADSTGLSKVYAGSVNIRFTGGAVRGNVFGGGESVPVLEGRGAGPGKTPESAVAEMVVDTVNIHVGDCIIDGSVYGAGKGLTGPGGFDDPKVFTMLVSEVTGSDGSVAESCRIYGVDWYEGSDALRYDPDVDYLGFAKVTADGISITFDGYRTDELPQATGREGSVYGGGMFGTAEVSGTVSITIEDSTVSDSVFGGGEGTPDSTAPGSLTASTVSVWVSGSKTIIGKESIPYSVIGGGRNAMVAAGEVYIVLEDGANLIGDVHGGGLGSESSAGSSFSTTEIMDANRAVVLNGANVYGNIYGGSRLGQDGSADSFKVSTVAVIDGTVTQSVYGGGFQGVSYLDSKIYIGTPAREVAQTFLGNRLSTEPTGRISMVSVFGGGNLSGAEPGSDQGDDSLLKGGVTIELGYGSTGRYATNPDDLRLEGDVFGEGNYSGLSEGKTAFVHIHDWRPTASTVKSIQRCDELLIENSRVELLGSTDGAVQGLTDLFSLAGVGRLQLDRSVLELNSATTRISEYVSTIDGYVSEREDCIRTGGTEFRGNEIVLHDGRPLTLVDYSSDGNSISLSVGTVSGFTLLTKAGDDSYYGAFAIGAPDDANAATTGFMVNDGQDEASVTDRIIADQKISTWYLAGHFTLSEQVVFDQPGPDAGEAVPKELDFHMPRLYRQNPNQDSPTVYTYISSYVTPTIQDGMYVVDGYDDYQPTEAEHRTYLSMTLKGGGGTSAATHKLNEGHNGWDRKVSSGHVFLGNSSMIYLDASLLIPKTVDGVRSTQSVGMLGEITIQLSESLPIRDGDGDITGYVPVNMIDLEISVYVRPYTSALNVTDIFVTVMTTKSGSVYSGRGYINLPSGDGDPITFRIASVTDLDSEEEEVGMWSDTTHLGLSGWTVIRYPDSSPCSLGGFDPQDGLLYFGEGGLRDTTIAFDYTGDGSGFEIVLKGTPNSDDPDAQVHTYNVTVRVQEAKDVLVDFSYESITVPGERYHLYVSGDGRSPDTKFEFMWVKETEPASAGYTLMSVPYGTLFTYDKFFSEQCPGGASLREVVESTLAEISVTVDGVEDKSTYRDFLTGWFVDPECISGFNTASPMSESMTLYAGLGVTVTFDGRGAGVNPQSVLLKPGQSLSDRYNNLDEDDPNKVSIWNGVELPGKHLYHYGGDKHSWMVKGDTPWDFSAGVYQDLDLYLRWDDDEYTINVTVTDEGGGTSTATLTVSGTDVTWDSVAGKIESKYGVPVSVGLDGTGSIITEATLFWDGGSASVAGVGTRTISFVTPDPGDESHAVPKEMNLAVTVSLGYTMTVDVVSMDNGLMVSGDRLRMYVGDGTTPYAEFSTSVTQATIPMKDGEVVKLRFEFVPGSSNQGRVDDIYWSYVEITDEGESIHVPWGQQIRGKTKAPFTSAPAESDVSLRVEVYVAVELAHIGEGISEIHVFEKTEYSDPLKEGDILFAGEPLYVYAGSGYYLPPSTTTGLSPTGQHGDGSSIFTVVGNRDVVIGDLSRIMVTLTIDVVAKDQAGGVIGNTGTWTLTVIVNQSTSRTFSDVAIGSQVKLDVPMNTDGNGYRITASSDGFEEGYVTIGSGSTSGTVELVLIEYTIVYLDPDGERLTGGTGVESWNILDGYKPPGYTLSDGTPATATGSVTGYSGQIWTVAGYRDGGYRSDGDVVTLITTARFASGTTLHLMATPVQQGGFEEPETSYITLRESDFGRTLEANLFDSDVTFRLNGYTIVYKVDGTTGAGTLTLPEGLRGTGTIMLESRQVTGETVRLVIQVVPEGAGDMDSTEAPDIVTKTV